MNLIDEFLDYLNKNTPYEFHETSFNLKYMFHKIVAVDENNEQHWFELGDEVLVRKDMWDRIRVCFCDRIVQRQKGAK